MASIKIAVTELSAKKATYTKAARNLREIMQTINKARTSIGNDRMFDRAKESMKKLVDLLDRRAFELEALAQVMGTSADSYNNAQTHVVSVVSDYKAHKQDFYGNPVHVSGAAGGAAGAAAAATASSASVPSGSSASAGGAAGSGTSYTTSSTSSSAGTGAAGGAAGESTVVNSYSETNTVNNYTQNNIYVSSSDAAGAAPAAAADVIQTSAGSVAAAAPAAAAGVAAAAGSAAASGSGLGAAAIGIGIGAAATAAGIGAAGIISSKKKEKKENGASSANSDIDKKLAEARKKLNALENEEETIKANLSEVTE